jgi:hypothetical protein
MDEKLTKMWLCKIRLTPRSGAGEPDVTKTAVVSGTRPAPRRRSKDQ